MNHTGNWMSSTWVRATRALTPALLFACATQEPPQDVSGDDDVVFEQSSDGAFVGVTKLGQEMAREVTSPEGSPGEDSADVGIQSGCTHIQWCNAPDPLTEVVCITNDRPCSCAARRAECKSDATAVCGNWTNITFNPPIFCP